MPELPEVETMVRGVRESFVGGRIGEFRQCPCLCRPLTIRPGFEKLRSESRDRTVVEVLRRAKRIVLRLDSGSGVVIEPRMTGLLLIDQPPDVEHLRLEWNMRHGRKVRRIWFWDRRGLGTVTLLNANQIQDLLEGPQLGRDALQMSPSDWREALGRTTRNIKVALLDQKLVAGIGNLYASEILHRAGIHPGASAASLSPLRITRLHAATEHILHEAIRHEGSTLGDGTYRNALNQDGGYQNQHQVYAREGEACRKCSRGTIVRIVQAQRSTFYCGSCQR